jgi:predicted ATPase/class 3 adenylate cyclase
MTMEAAPAAGPPTGTVTFLFTDIEGSTRLLREVGEQYAAILAEQRRLLREAIRAWGGREIDTAGDAFFVAFDRAREAVSAAVAAQRRMAEHRWPRDVAVRVRMGLHTGEPTLSGGTYIGIDVHRAARICAAAHGGQVLLSQTTGDIVQHGLPGGAALRDLGRHQLKDLQHPEHLFQVVIPDLPSDFPALRALEDRPNNLPAQPNPLIGREEELDQVCRLLRGPARLVTLSGPGGTGKTRLAIQAGTSLLDTFADGVFFVPLAPIQDPNLAASRIATVLGVRENPARSAIESLLESLQGKHLLLLLDNFEQIVAAAPTVTDLLAACRQLKILVTSRIVLHVGGEHELAVPPLRLPEPKRELEPETLARSPSVALFLQRAQAVKAGFTLTGENAGEVARICTQLDGLPLAIELAAARVKLLPPHAILHRLGSRLDFLRGGARDAPARHQTLRHAIAWSYELLERDERPFFRRLTVFVGGFTLEAAEQVCADLVAGGTGGLDAVAALVDKSLLRQADGKDGESRFGMLETIREFGVECLKAEGEWEQARRAHAETFLALAEQAETELTGPQQIQWLDRLEAEHDNLRVALAWAEEQGEVETGLRLGAAVWRFWLARGHMREGRDRLERLLALPGAAARTGARAKALHRLGTIVHEISDYAQARPPLAESLAIWQELGDKRGTATALNSMGWLAYQSGNFEAAVSLSQEALALHRALGDTRGIAVALFNLGFVTLYRSDYPAALALLEESLALRHGIGDRRGSAYVQVHLGWLEHQRGDYGRASQILEEARATFRELNDWQLLAWSLSSLAVLAYDLGELDRARVLLEESLSLAREVGNQAMMAWALSHLGEVVHGQGTPELATALTDEGIGLWRRIGGFWVADALLGRGRIAQAAEELDRAAVLYLESLDVWSRLGAPRGMAACLEAIAGLTLAQGKPEVAARLYAAADTAREAIGAPRPPRLRAAHEQAIGALRRELGEDAFAAAWAEGRRLALEHACDYARRAITA